MCHNITINIVKKYREQKSNKIYFNIKLEIETGQHLLIHSNVELICYLRNEIRVIVPHLQYFIVEFLIFFFFQNVLIDQKVVNESEFLNFFI